ncbi:alpha/beta fold hydrolase [Marinobacterium sediminicola]|uniref:Pimeloyl-ACP methyl ester carboxylesterase n=1 Tax=Marinobacterium sediminicola TaxID=518898 RepID=A0ABY1RVP2_9GAMM|nr:alpha/beta hydrolase [Marinobacterium sediminicola]ULG70611.1 alpha/beta hydrolase [Marinobacterium sediminicola]SMR68880.1 Pimeloyl-ACP methyl ester carboxylesterase [Marinobacterium sediminicola]
MMAEELRFEVNGQLMAARAIGPVDGRPVLALHGWLDNAASFRALEPHLESVRLVALDLVGHGFSAHRPEAMPYYIWDNVADVLAVADELGWERFHLLGHSMGAGVSSLLAGVMPDRVLSLVLLEGLAPMADSPEELPEKMALAIRRRQRRERTPKYYPDIDAAVQARMKGKFPVTEQAARWLVERSIVHTPQGFRWRSDPALVLPSVMRLSEDQVRAFLSRIDSPALLLMGSEGIGTPLLDERAELIAGLRRITFEGNHHLHLEEGPARLMAAAINDFYAGV